MPYGSLLETAIKESSSKAVLALSIFEILKKYTCMHVFEHLLCVIGIAEDNGLLLPDPH